jgi:inosine-uridine nucleoside N-ribohydrolase
VNHIILDTDMGNDVDDALAMAVLHTLDRQRMCTFDAVILSRPGHDAAAMCAAINQFYGRGDIPVGVMHEGPIPQTNRFLHVASHYPHNYDAATAPEAVSLLRARLQALPDQSVSIVHIGFATNMARMLANADDVALIRRKVKVVSIMAGAFAPIDGDAAFKEFNVICDIPAMQRFAREWPTPVVWGGFEIGWALRYPRVSIAEDFSYQQPHIIVDAYNAYCEPAEERPCWDLATALYAAYPERGYFGVSAPGQVQVADDGVTTFVAHPSGQHRHLQMDALQQARVLEALVRLVTARPA